ncbi:MAG: 2-C-methyl-D-erythritol 2,4-cyclodiphosphate synthase [Candidatus Eiseniibacteriota bacterium]|nr:MAG: 2-C-methyl-D-erythritol 2,4-cyclodiphosphate synthase [Candidatus Eisenbacteria bacterium]
MKHRFKVGLGYDAHPFADDRALVLGGVKVLSARGLSGHSDADVLCHAIADALLGSISAGDIGQLFPDTEPEYRGVSSLVILSRVGDLLREKGVSVANVDAVLAIEEPRVSPHFDEMRENVAKALKTEPRLVSVKATRNEAMGFVGRKEGAAAIAVVLVSPGD